MSDHLIRALALEGRVRVAAARTTVLAEELRRIHDPSPHVATLLGQAATAALLLAAASEKLAGREPVLTLDIEGDGPLGRLTATASPAGWVRAFARHPEAAAGLLDDGTLDLPAVVGRQGSLSVVRDLGYGQPYRGVVPLAAGRVAQDVALYLSDSEQTPAAIALGLFLDRDGAVTHAGGLLIQLLGGVSDEEAEEIGQRVTALGDLTTRLRTGLGPDEWLVDLFGEGFEIVDRYPVEFRCGCSPERVERALKLLGAAEIEALRERVAAEGRAEVTCEFCRTTYTLDDGHLVRLLDELADEAAARAAVPPPLEIVFEADDEPQDDGGAR